MRANAAAAPDHHQSNLEETMTQPNHDPAAVPGTRPEWLYGSGCCQSWTPESGCQADHTGRPAMSLAARELGSEGAPAASSAGPQAMHARPPLATERQATALPAVRAVYDAMHAHTGHVDAAYRERIDGMCSAMITGACEAAGVELGAYDRRIIGWLGNWEPQICAVIAGLITRAHAAGSTR